MNAIFLRYVYKNQFTSYYSIYLVLVMIPLVKITQKNLYVQTYFNNIMWNNNGICTLLFTHRHTFRVL